MIKQLLIILLFASSFCVASAQQADYYGSPVDFPITLAGNVAEVRSDHFHSGIDIKASKGVGSPILAVADGYVSRVFVSPTGYGYALYITHPNGQTSVYGHLNDFEKSIAQWVDNQQLAAKSFRVDLYPPATKFPVKRGELIGYMGNRGSSGGPHLHFEIRDANGSPINIIKQGIYTPTDKISPNIYTIALYELDTVLDTPRFTAGSSISIKRDKSGDWVLSDTILRASKPFYLAYEVIDYKNGSSNTMGIYSLTQYVDDTEQFSFAIDRLSFATSRYINTYIEYARNRGSKSHFIRAYLSANNALSIYRNVVNRGIIAPPTADKMRQISTTITDDAGNSSTVSFCVALDTDNRQVITLSPSTYKVAWNEDVTVTNSDLSVTFGSRSLYDSALLPFSIEADGIIQIGDDKVPLQKPIKISIKQEITPELQNKALLIDQRRKSTICATYNNGWLTAELRRMGRFSVDYDTISPKIGAPVIKNGSIKWKVADEQSGVDHYKLTVDGQWAVMEWDPKSSTMSYRIEKKQATTQKHIVAVEVSDNKQNRSYQKTTLEW